MIQADDRLKGLFDEAIKIARQHKHEYITLEHLLAVLLQQPEIAEMVKDGRTDIEIRNFDSSIPDGKIYCRKQRATGEYPMENLWFHKDSQRFTMKPLSPIPFIEL